MNKIARIYLLLVAVMCGGAIVITGASFSSTVEEEPLGYIGIIFWLLFGIITVTPLIISAFIPSNWQKTFLFARRFTAMYTMIPIYLFSSIVIHNITNLLTVKGWEISIQSLSFSIVAGVCCIGAFVVLMWPEIKHVQRVLITRK